jgi:hypothetical protein
MPNALPEIACLLSIIRYAYIVPYLLVTGHRCTKSRGAAGRRRGVAREGRRDNDWRMGGLVTMD